MNSRDTTRKIMSGVKKSSIRIGHFNPFGEHAGVIGCRSLFLHAFDLVEQFHGPLSPNGPVSQQSALKLQNHFTAALLLWETVISQQIRYDIVDVTGILCDIRVSERIR